MTLEKHPEFYTATGRIAPELFELSHERDRTLFIFHGPEPVVLHRVVFGDMDLASLVGKTLQPDAAVAFLHEPGRNVGALPGEVHATGNVMRNGKVVRDNRTPESDASDADYNARYLVQTEAVLRSLLVSAASPEVLEKFLRSRSYGDADSRAELLARVRANAASGT